jgi:dUTP pyrophosphatase
MLTLYVKYHNDNARPIQQAHLGEWVDLRTAEEVTLIAGQHEIIPLGVSIKLPTGYEALMAMRSSSMKNFGIFMTNSPGVIDETYCGDQDEWKASIIATRNVTIPAGSRIAQFRIQPIQPPFKIVEVEQLSDENRGGIGSTGTA